jgi:hypothetical protein
MAGLRFTVSSDGVPRAVITTEFRAGLNELETGIIYAYENTDTEIALREIPQLSKADVVELVKKLFREKGYGHEFIGESMAGEVTEAAEARVAILWPDLADD